MLLPSSRLRLARTATAGLTALAVGRPAVLALTGPGTPSAGVTQQQRLALEQFDYAQENVLGTSLDLAVLAARPGDAVRCQEAVLTEIERLRAILSTYDPASEISRVSLGLQSATSPELVQLLAAYDDWSARTGGAVDARLANVMRLWRDAACTGRLPADADLRAALIAPGALNVDALGKARIIDRAVELARRLVPAGLLNIGGDLRAWGDATWQVGVADPRQPAENAPLLTTFALRNAAVATTGDYARPLTVAGRDYSHLIDPRTLAPVEKVSSATVVASDCVTANALAAAASVLGGPAASMLIQLHQAMGHLVLDREGGDFRGGIFGTAATEDPFAVPGSPPRPDAPKVAAPAPASLWPKDFQVSVTVALKAQMGGRGGKRPYMAVWVEDANHKLVRTISVFGTAQKYLPELTNWWSLVRGNQAASRSVTRATRPAGEYTVVWDGFDTSGKPVPRGDYTVFIEINREHGSHVVQSAKIACADVAVAVPPLNATSESDSAKFGYGPKPAPAK